MIVTLKNKGFTAQVDTMGAQLVSLKDSAGKEYIWQRDPAYWQNCSPLLFPTVGNCRNGKTQIEGSWYELPKHGFCKITDFSVEQHSEDQAVFTIRDSGATRTMYPYAFRLSLTYTLQDTGLHMDYEVENMDSKAICYQIGAHPGFNCPLDSSERFEDYILEFEKKETAQSMVYDASHLQFDVNHRKPMLNHSNTLPLSYELFVDDAIFFDELASRKVAIKNPTTGKGVEVDFRDFETVAFWTAMPSKGPFLCVEPWNGSAIRSDEDDELKNRHFIQTLTVGEKRGYHLGIRIL